MRVIIFLCKSAGANFIKLHITESQSVCYGKTVENLGYIGCVVINVCWSWETFYIKFIVINRRKGNSSIAL